jgi:hypothetical protein
MVKRVDIVIPQRVKALARFLTWLAPPAWARHITQSQIDTLLLKWTSADLAANIATIIPDSASALRTS